ncbi:MAG: hypothetical protein R3C19_25380 [Planctomycetaceae bacterium]
MSNNTANGSSKKPSLYAYSVRDAGNGKGFWTRIGAAWTNKDGGFNLQLDCIPLDGRIVCQPPKAEDDSAPGDSAQ